MPPEEFSLDSDTAALADGMLDAMPEVQEHAIAAAQAGNSSEEIPAAGNELVDDFGTVFNPEIHTGSRLKNGAWRARKKKSESFVAAPRSAGAPVAGNPAPPVADESAAARMAGATAAESFMGICYLLGGSEWEPMEKPVDERAYQRQIWGDYFAAKQIKDFPPGAALALGLLAYIAPRLTQPETKKKVGRLGKFITLRVAKYKVKRALKKRGINAEVTISEGAVLVNGKTLENYSFDSEK